MALFVLSGFCGPCAAAPAAATPAADASGTGAGPAGGSTPQADQTAEPTPDVAGACKKTVASLANGDLKVLEPGPSGGSRLPVNGGAAEPALTCLAVGAGNVRFCDALKEQAKQNCAGQVKFVGELKGLPKEAIKAHVFFRLCQSGDPKPEPGTCEKIREAMVAGKAAQCASLSQSAERDLCTALASGDPSTCSTFTDERRAFCAAFATEDVKRCPKDSDHCRQMIGTIVALRTQGPQGAEGLDPIIAAAGGGKQACAPLLATLERACREHQ